MNLYYNLTYFSLISHNFFAVSMLLDSSDDLWILLFTKYSPVMFSTSLEVAKYMDVSAAIFGFFPNNLKNVRLIVPASLPRFVEAIPG